MDPKTVQGLQELAGAPLTRDRQATAQDSDQSWFRALANAWGKTLDQQAQKISDMSDNLGQGEENPSDIVELTAESLRMQFLSNSQSTSTNSVGQALETMARKQ